MCLTTLMKLPWPPLPEPPPLLPPVAAAVAAAATPTALIYTTLLVKFPHHRHSLLFILLLLFLPLLGQLRHCFRFCSHRSRRARCVLPRLLLCIPLPPRPPSPAVPRISFLSPRRQRLHRRRRRQQQHLCSVTQKMIIITLVKEKVELLKSGEVGVESVEALVATDGVWTLGMLPICSPRSRRCRCGMRGLRRGCGTISTQQRALALRRRGVSH
jgi:hypothetical protein